MKLQKCTFLLSFFSTAFFLTVGFFSPLFPLFLSNTAYAAEAALTWDANSESNLAGYKLYYESETDDDFYGGTDANEGDSPITIYLPSLADPDSPTYTITGLEEGTYYYFALTAFDTDGMESDFSAEVGGLMADGEKSKSGNSGCFLTYGSAHRNKLADIIAVVAVLLGAYTLKGLVNLCVFGGKKSR